MPVDTLEIATPVAARAWSLRDVPVGPVIFLVLLGALLFAAGLMYPEVTMGLGLLF